MNQTSKRLFMLRERSRSAKPITNVYFSNKMDAKVARDSSAYGTDLVVVLGPDHRRYNNG